VAVFGKNIDKVIDVLIGVFLVSLLAVGITLLWVLLWYIWIGVEMV
jgi:hypothetical protein